MMLENWLSWADKLLMMLENWLSWADKLFIMLENWLSWTDKLFEMYIKNHYDAFKVSCSTSLIIATDYLMTMILIFRTTCIFDFYTLVILQDQIFDYLLNNCNILNTLHNDLSCRIMQFYLKHSRLNIQD